MQNLLLVLPRPVHENKTQKHLTHWVFAPVVIMTKVDVDEKNTKTHGIHWLCVQGPEEKTQKHTKHMPCASALLKLKENTHNTYMWWAYVLMGLTTRLQKTYKINALIIWS